MPLSLDSVENFLLREMQDEIEITYPLDDDEGIYNPNTGLYDTYTTNTALYTGKAMITTFGQESRPRILGGYTTGANTYTVRIPKGSVVDEIPFGSRILITSSLRDPLAVGEELKIQTLLHSTFSVAIKMYAELIHKEVD